MAFWRLPRLILRPGHGNAAKWPSGGFLGLFCGLGLEMLQNNFLEASWAYSMAWVWKCSKMAFWRLPGHILRPGLGNAAKWPCGGFLGLFCGLGLEMLQNGFLEASWAHSAAWAWQCSKIAFWRLPGPILRPGLGNASKWPSGSFLGLFCGLGLEMLQNGLLEASWAYSAAWAWKCFKMAFRRLPKPILRPGLGNIFPNPHPG